MGKEKKEIPWFIHEIVKRQGWTPEFALDIVERRAKAAGLSLEDSLPKLWGIKNPKYTLAEKKLAWYKRHRDEPLPDNIEDMELKDI